MKGAISALAIAASVVPALAVPGWNRGDNNIAEVINHIEEAHKGAWKPGNGGYWGHGPGGKPSGSWGPPSKPSDVVVSPVMPSSGSVVPTGYSNASTSSGLWSNTTRSSNSGSWTTLTTVTDVISYYTTVVPWTSTSTSNGAAQTTSGLTMSTKTLTQKSTITITKTVSVVAVEPLPTKPAGGNGGSGGKPASNVIDPSSTSAYLTYITAPISEVGSNPNTMNPVAYGTWTPDGASSAGPTHLGGGWGPKTTTVTTEILTTITTVVPCTETVTSNGVTTTTQKTTTSTLTSTITKTLTLTQTATQTTTLSGVTIKPTDGSSSSASVSTIYDPTGISSSGSSYTTFTTTCSESGSSVVHTHSQPYYNGTTSSIVVGPTGTGSSYSTYTTTCTEGNTTTLHTHSIPVTTTSYSGNGTTSSLPTAPASYTSSSTISGNSTSSSTSSSVCVKPTQFPKRCVPCEGQSGTPENHCGLTINDNPYDEVPNTCQTRFYDFELTNSTVSPDGIPRLALLVNGQFPGPKIEANWGDNIVVRVKNSMQSNGSTIHWHGIRQNYTNEMDGVASITQCPIAPGDTMTYRFRADNYGFSWYHAHIAIQAYMGVFGPMVIHGPKSVEGDFAEELMVLNDWSHVTVDSMYQAAQTVGPTPEHGPRVMDTGLINGMNVWGVDGAANATGKRYSTTIQPGETRLFRILNAAIQSTFIFSVDNHVMQVIANDFVPIVPYTTNAVAINPGQRYDVLITFNQAPGNYWFRADNQQDCTQTIAWDNIKSIIHYANAPAGTPNSTAQGYEPGCRDEPLNKLVPYYALDAGVTKANPLVETVTIAGNAANLYKWSMNGVTFESKWENPTLQSIVNNGTIPPYSGPLAIEVPNLGEWVYVIIQSPIPLPHPVHLHGHDFYVLAQGTGLYDSSVALNLRNPTRRDTANMPGQRGQGGYLVIAFFTDNPGAWLLHCHIGWHNAMGFALQIIEAQDQIKTTITDSCGSDNTCKKYIDYATANNIHTDDSGV